jgi:hypothetical protein
MTTCHPSIYSDLIRCETCEKGGKKCFLDQHRDVVSHLGTTYVICLFEATAREFDHAYTSTVVLCIFAERLPFYLEDSSKEKADI